MKSPRPAIRACTCRRASSRRHTDDSGRARARRARGGRTRARRLNVRGTRVGHRAGARVLAALAIVAALVAGCSLSGTDDASDQSLVLVTHDSFHLSDGVLETFTDQTGIPVEVQTSGDAGKLASRLVLTKDDPVGDVAFGVDNTFASRVVGQGVFADYVSPEASAGADRFAVPGTDELTAIDYGDVCLNVDDAWFAAHAAPAPETLFDLTEPQYKGLTVVENPATSSPGLAFLLATIAAQPATAAPDAWQDYWRALRGNGVEVVDGWTQAYDVEFSGSAGHGSRPIVVSYATSPPAEVGADGSAPTTSVVEASCFRQVEYAGVLAGAAHPDAARQFIDFLLSERVQQDIPGQMYVMPVQEHTPLPADFEEYAAQPDDPLELDPETIGEHRDEWIRQWRGVVLD